MIAALMMMVRLQWSLIFYSLCSLIYEYICNLFVQVATPGSIEFGGAIAEEEAEKWMLVKDQEASFQCISRSR